MDIANGYCGRCHAFTGDEVQVRLYAEELAENACPVCSEKAFWIDMRETLVAKPIGTFSLAGQQPKVSAIAGVWPWIVCGNCGFEEKAKVS